ncbi:hypothetical protein ACLOJK_031062 [Asimina triloba]
MLVLGVNSKRQRRPNVRLVEIGDTSVAFACGISQKRLKEDRIPQLWPLSAPVVLPRVSAEAHNRENWDPNSGKIEWDLSSSNCADDCVKTRLDSEATEPETCDFGGGNPTLNSDAVNPNLGCGAAKPRLDFGKVTRKSRAMKRRGWSSKGNGGVGSVWNSLGKPGIYNGNENFADEHLKGSFASGTSKDAFDNGDSDDYWMGNVCKENNGLSSDNGDCSGHKIGTAVNSVRVWLEEHGFSKYAGLFQMHEVDEEALPLLTLEDLREMGINAVGTRRKIFTEIQLLKKRALA